MRGAFLIAALATFAGCDAPADVAVLTADATVSDAIRTVITVDWTTDVDASGYVAYGPTADLGWTTAITALGTDHQSILLGMPADTDVHWQVVVVGDDGTETAEPETVTTTGSLPVELPGVITEGDSAGRYFGVPVLGATTAATIFDPQGRIVWYHVDERGLDLYRMRPNVDGSGIVYNAASVSGDPSDASELVFVSWDGTQETTIEVPLLAHDFIQHEDGTLAAIVVEYRGEGEDEIRGDQIVEIAPDGTQTVVWSAWDCFDPAETGADEADEGWTFANALDYDPVEDAYYLGMRSFSSIARIDRGTGACAWVFGEQGATVQPEVGEPSFLHQHQFEVLGDRLLVFDNDGAPGTASRVVEYDVDFAGGTATERWSYQPEPSLYSFVLGDVYRFDDEDTLVTWSVVGQIDRVTVDRDIAWRLNTDLGYALGFNTVLGADWPTTPR